tara:strand:- start:330 stop:1412 length:1083 start_codon:yes stop_codon:yes gene_type:complete
MEYMSQALELAKDALGISQPNPPVGAVVVKDGRVVGKGHTMRIGGPHAEVVAIREAGNFTEDAILYTTLEPCCHFGRTPPCTDLIIESGIREIRVATIDPNPKVSGRGIAVLKDAGLTVQLGDGEKESLQIAEGYMKLMATGRPFVTAKFAMSLDGKIASPSGDSKWITSRESRDYVGRMRSQVGAVMAGIGTVLEDNPRLTARNSEGNELPTQPLKLIVDSNARIPLDSALFDGGGEVIVAACGASVPREEALENRGVKVIRTHAKDGMVDLRDLLLQLGNMGVNSVIVEGGETLLGSFADLRLIDKVVAFIAPVIIGGSDSPSPIGGSGITGMEEIIKLERTQLEVFGKDIMVTGYIG